jgi:hypothetical protein
MKAMKFLEFVKLAQQPKTAVGFVVNVSPEDVVTVFTPKTTALRQLSQIWDFRFTVQLETQSGETRVVIDPNGDHASGVRFYLKSQREAFAEGDSDV